jgi:hypothetical protein
MCAAAAWSGVWNCVPTQISAAPSRTSTVQLRGSIGACARNGTSYSATSVFAADLIASGLSAFFAIGPGVFAAATSFARRPAVSSFAFGPRSQSISSASRPFFAAQKFVATTATALPMSTTCVTPATFCTFAASKARSFAPNTGGCATTAVRRSLRFTSMPNCALPSTFSAESRRRVGLPTSLNDLGSLSVTWAGTATFAAASASCPYDAFLPPGPSTKPFSVRRSAGFAFHWSAAACTSIARACAPAVRICSKEFVMLDDPPTIWMPNTVCAYSGAAGASA